MKKIKSAIDSEIEREYYKQAQGMTISILDIPILFANSREHIKEGLSVSESVGKSIARYCQPA